MGLAPAVGEARKDVEERTRPFGIDVDWTTAGEYFERVQATEPSINVVPMVAQGTVRMAVMGYRDDAPLPHELAAMQGHVAEAMKSGARGMCSGLRYVPSGYATVDELVELAKVVHDHGGVYATHMRSEGDNGEWLDAIDEALAVGRGSGVRVQLSHLKALGTESWGRSGEALAHIEKARADGVDVAGDQYPYAATSSTLFLLFPQWSQEGGIGAFLERMADSEQAAKIGSAFETTLAMRGGPSRMTVSEYAPDPPVQGKTLAAIAEMRGKSEFDTAVELLRESDAHVSMIYHTLEEDDIETIFREPFVMVASDGSAVAPYGALASDYYPHPRNYGCFPKVLGDFVRTRHLVDLGEAIRKMTSLPAERFNLGDRGQLRPDWRADITVFDPATVADRATFASPRQYPAGIRHVFVNGELVLDGDDHTGARPGRVLYANGARGGSA
jgi:N-acyl-D-amino-acid deacylase